MRRKIFLLVIIAASTVLVTNCQKLKSRDELNKGVQAFKNAQYPVAVEHFKTAVELDPTFPTARLYLATAYMQQYIPGVGGAENEQMGNAAEEQFLKVLETDPRNEVAIASIASLKLNQKKWDDAEGWYQKQIAINPKSADSYYGIGFVAWSRWYIPYTTARQAAGMKQDEPGPIRDKKIKEELKAKYLPIINNGLAALDKVLEINPDNDDAMAYENLLVRERADLMDTPEQYKKEIAVADNWVDRTMAKKKEKAEKKANATPGGVVLDQKPDQK
jgi:hypothetical protein